MQTTQKLLIGVVLVVVACMVLTCVQPKQQETKPRIIATTDGEIDDRCSMVRFLLYANEWDIEGLIYSSSKFHWKGHNWAGEEWIEQDIDRYASFYENLKKHDPDFPSPEALKNVVYVGNIDSVGSMDKDTPGSDRIVEVLLDDEPGPVWLQAWGGTNTIARALWKIQHEHPDQMEKVSEKAVIYIILDQDTTYRDYIQTNWPELTVLMSSSQFAAVAYNWEELIPERLHNYFNGDWMNEHILQDHGPLCSRYEAHNDGRFRSEGDSPAFMHQIDVGLRSLEDPTYGGWGGRFAHKNGSPGLWENAKDDGDVFKPIWRWAAAFQNDFAARADWCVKNADEANHPPVVKLAHHENLQATSGEAVRLDAASSTDPDGDSLSFNWWQYVEPGSYESEIEIIEAQESEAYFYVPEDVTVEPKTVHVICEVTDNGTPPLTRYKRVIVTCLPE